VWKQVLLLGLLKRGPMYGQQVYEAIERDHAPFIRQARKPTIYYQLERLAADGLLDVLRETVPAPGPGLAHATWSLRERVLYRVTPGGREHFRRLLRKALRSHDPVACDFDAALQFAEELEPDELRRLLAERRDAIAGALTAAGPPAGLAGGRARALLETEIAWLDARLAM
jgi:DNA-binding PadR family transcriptional regulator